MVRTETGKESCVILAAVPQADGEAPGHGTDGWHRVLAALLAAAVVWLGEISIGCVPLLSHFLIAAVSIHPFRIMTCAAPAAECLPVPDVPYAEMNIVSVVITGLGLLSLFRLGAHGRRARFTPLTYSAAIADIGLLIIGSILYALNSAFIGQGGETLTNSVLGLAALISLYLALEEAWLEALETMPPARGA